MKNIIIIILLFFISGIKAQEVVVMTYNIKGVSSDNSINNWENRNRGVLELIKKNEPIVFGLQEALKIQVDFVKQNSKYDYIGYGSEDDISKGEYSSVFYDIEKVKLLENGTFFLSESSEKSSKSWDVKQNRTVVWAKFSYAGVEFYFFNIHMDYKGKSARQKSVELILNKVLKIAGDLPVFVVGDFDFESHSCNYQLIVDPMVETVLYDSFFNAKTSSFDRVETYRGFSIEPNNYSGRIDYIFYKNRIVVENYKIDYSNNGIFYYSEHLPVVVKASFLNLK